MLLAFLPIKNMLKVLNGAFYEQQDVPKNTAPLEKLLSRAIRAGNEIQYEYIGFKHEKLRTFRDELDKINLFLANEQKVMASTRFKLKTHYDEIDYMLTSLDSQKDLALDLLLTFENSIYISYPRFRVRLPDSSIDLDPVDLKLMLDTKSTQLINERITIDDFLKHMRSLRISHIASPWTFSEDYDHPKTGATLEQKGHILRFRQAIDNLEIYAMLNS